jgi:hypothetical protein
MSASLLTPFIEDQTEPNAHPLASHRARLWPSLALRWERDH